VEKPDEEGAETANGGQADAAEVAEKAPAASADAA
jgi:hypothetical protein